MIQSGSGVGCAILAMGGQSKVEMGVLYPVLFELFNESTCTNVAFKREVIGPRTDLVIDPADWSRCFCQKCESAPSLIRIAT